MNSIELPGRVSNLQNRGNRNINSSNENKAFLVFSFNNWKYFRKCTNICNNKPIAFLAQTVNDVIRFHKMLLVQIIRPKAVKSSYTKLYLSQQVKDTVKKMSCIKVKITRCISFFPTED